MTSDTCATCRYRRFDRCHRTAPKGENTVVFENPEDDSAEYPHHITARWPVIAMDDWCGEHEPIQPAAPPGLPALRAALAPFKAIADACDFLEVDEADTFILDVEGKDGPIGLTPTDFHQLMHAFNALAGE